MLRETPVWKLHKVIYKIKGAYHDTNTKFIKGHPLAKEEALASTMRPEKKWSNQCLNCSNFSRRKW